MADALAEHTVAEVVRLRAQLLAFIPLVSQAIEQVVQRVLEGKTLSAADKIVSLCEPHTQIIRRGKAPPRDTEFGHKVNYGEVEHGLVSDWQVIPQGNPPDAQLLPPVLRAHRKRFGHAPRMLAGDRGVFSPDNEDLARQLGVAQIVLPQRGYRTAERRAYEKQRWFKNGLRFRTGIEGRISVLRRTVQLRRCPYRGLDGFERWVGWVAGNLTVMGRISATCSQRLLCARTDFSNTNYLNVTVAHERPPSRETAARAPSPPAKSV